MARYGCATTPGGNAIQEREGARKALITTAGGRNVFETRLGMRSSVHDLCLEYPEPVVPRWRRFGPGYLNGRPTAAEGCVLAICASVRSVLPRMDRDIPCIAVVDVLAGLRYLRPGPNGGT